MSSRLVWRAYDSNLLGAADAKKKHGRPQEIPAGPRHTGDMRAEDRDEDLAARAAAGEPHAFATLLERHYRRIFRLSFRLMGAKAEAEDLTQDVCMALPERLGSWRGEGKFTTWLYRVVVNAAHDRRRRQAARGRAAEGWAEAELSRQASNAQAKEAASWLAGAMRTLPEALRETMVLTVGEGLSHGEAAEVLGVSEGTVSWRVFEVKRRLGALAEEETR